MASKFRSIAGEGQPVNTAFDAGYCLTTQVRTQVMLAKVLNLLHAGSVISDADVLTILGPNWEVEPPV